MVLLISLKIVETQQNLPQKIFGFVVFEAIIIGLMIIYGKMGRQG